MVERIEQYEVPGVGRLAIEDYESPGAHFFKRDYDAGKCGRFRLWSGGSSFGTAGTVEEARHILACYIGSELGEQRNDLQKKSQLVQESIGVMITNNLRKFEVRRNKRGQYTKWEFPK